MKWTNSVALRCFLGTLTEMGTVWATLLLFEWLESEESGTTSLRATTTKANVISEQTGSHALCINMAVEQSVDLVNTSLTVQNVICLQATTFTIVWMTHARTRVVSFR